MYIIYTHLKKKTSRLLFHRSLSTTFPYYSPFSRDKLKVRALKENFF